MILWLSSEFEPEPYRINFWTPFIDNVKLVEMELTLLASLSFSFAHHELLRWKKLPSLFLLPGLLLELPGLLLEGHRTGPSRPNDGKPILW